MFALLKLIVKCFAKIFQLIASGVIALVADSIDASTFTPSLEKFSQMFGATSFELLQKTFAIAAIVIFGAVIGIQLISLLLSPVRGDLKESIGQIVVRIGVAAMLLFIVPSFLNASLNAANKLDTKIMETIGDINDSELEANGSPFINSFNKEYEEISSSQKKEANFDPSQSGSVKDVGIDPQNVAKNNAKDKNAGKNKEGDAIAIADGAFSTLGLASTAATAGITGSILSASSMAAIMPLILLLIDLVLLLGVAYTVLKVVLEIIQKYVTMVLLYLTSPLFCGFFASVTTENVFFSWIKMTLVSMFLLVFNKLWAVIMIYLLKTMDFTLVNALFIMAIGKFWGSIESQLSKAGLSSASMGSSLLDTFTVTSAAAIAGTSKIGKGVLGVGANATVLGGMPALAGFMNGMKGGGFGALPSAEFMTDSLGGQLRNGLGKAGVGPFVKMSDGEKKMLSSVSANGRAGQNAIDKALASMPTSKKLSALDSLLGAYSVTQKDANGDEHLIPLAEAFDAGGFNSVRVTDQDGNGINGIAALNTYDSNGEVTGRRECPFRISIDPDNPNAIPLDKHDANGQQMYLSMNTDAFKLKDGEKLNIPNIQGLDENGNRKRGSIAGIDAASAILGKNSQKVFADLGVPNPDKYNDIQLVGSQGEVQVYQDGKLYGSYNKKKDEAFRNAPVFNANSHLSEASTMDKLLEPDGVFAQLGYRGINPDMIEHDATTGMTSFYTNENDDVHGKGDTKNFIYSYFDTARATRKGKPNIINTEYGAFAVYSEKVDGQKGVDEMPNPYK
ncbi:MAG: hypothetical protein K6E51_11245 [Treponema sp.]|nr:hypothetical protein [Treponema sp.]